MNDKKVRVAIKYKVYQGFPIECSKCGKICNQFIYSIRVGDKFSVKRGFGNLEKYLCDKCVKYEDIDFIFDKTGG